MATPIVSSKPLPPEIKHTEAVTHDEYEGTAEALIAAGLVRRDQFPEKVGVIYINGKVVKGHNYRKTSGYLRVSRNLRAPGQWIVVIGLAAEIAAARRTAQAARVQAEDEARRLQEREHRATPRSSNVIPFRRRSALPSAQKELVEFYNEMAAKAARGEHSGVMYVVANEYDEDEWCIRGSLAEDMPRATILARRGFEAFQEYKAEMAGLRSPGFRSGWGTHD